MICHVMLSTALRILAPVLATVFATVLLFSWSRVCAVNGNSHSVFFRSHNTAPAETLKRLTITAISKLEAIGLHVIVVLCDQGATNQQMFRMFGFITQPANG